MALTPVLAYNGINSICILLFASETTFIYHYFAFDSLFCILMLILFSIWLSKIRSYNPETQSLSRKEPHMMLKIPILTLGMNGISSLWFILIALYLESIPLISNSLQSFDDTWSTIEAEPYFWVLLSVVLVGPIVEELLFRGIMFHYLEKVKSGWFPILISGITFGLWHMEPVQVVYAALMGIILGIVYAKVRDLRVTIALHILNNFLSTLPPFMDTPIVQEVIFHASLLMVLPTIYIMIHMMRKLPAVTEINLPNP